MANIHFLYEGGDILLSPENAPKEQILADKLLLLMTLPNTSESSGSLGGYFYDAALASPILDIDIVANLANLALDKAVEIVKTGGEDIDDASAIVSSDDNGKISIVIEVDAGDTLTESLNKVILKNG